jgi:hypothetical protein
MRSELLIKTAESLDLNKQIEEFFAKKGTVKQVESSEMRKENISMQESNRMRWRAKEALK